jgi:hypothetical protein
MHEVITTWKLVLELIAVTGWRIGFWPFVVFVVAAEWWIRHRPLAIFYDAREVARALGWGPTLNPSHDVVSAVESQKPARERVAA